MNVSLYNALVNAYNFFINDERNCEAIKMYESKLRLCKLERAMNTPTPAFSYEPISWSTAILWILICFPIGLIYILSNKIKNSINQRKYERNKKKLVLSPEEIEVINKKTSEIAEAEKALQQAKQAQEMYYRNNYERCLSFLPECLRYKNSIASLMHYVKSGQAITLDAAWNLHARDLRELDEMRMRDEEREEQARRHRETQEALDTIARNQEKINRELEIANGYRTGRYR